MTSSVDRDDLPPRGSPGSRPLRLCLFGAPDDTGNLGVSALLHGTLAELGRHAPDADVTVFDVHATGERMASTRAGDGDLTYRVVGGRLTRRLYQHESLWHLHAATRLGLSRSPGARAMRRADAVLDISGGDSFSDLYGPRRFTTVTLPKRTALAHGIPLVLLPQTYGPFEDPATRRRAAGIVRRARMAWARDPDSFAALRELAGDDFDPSRHRLGVDVAFATPPAAPAEPLVEPLSGWLEGERRTPVVGLNVSGLVYLSPDAGQRFGIDLDYPALVLRLVRRLLHDSDARVVLVHHLQGTGGREPDEKAQQHLRAQLSEAEQERVALAPSGYDARRTKWLIGQLDWFCGTRMHATIGALSSGVPAASIAYSMKTRGVFATCGQERYVADARLQAPGEALETVWRSFTERDEARARLRAALTSVRAQCRAQMQEVVAACGERLPPG